MTRPKIQEIADLLVQASNPETAYFGFDEYGGDASDEWFVKANKDGLQLFAAELLFTTIDVDEHNIRVPDQEGVWFDNSLLQIDYIELVERKREAIKKETPKSEASESIFTIGCLLLIFFSLVCMVVGLIAIIRWLI